MVFLLSRTFNDTGALETTTLNHSTRLIIDLLDVVHNVRDGDHLQCIAFLAQELGMLTHPCFLFGSVGSDEMRRPYSLLLESHLYSLLHEGLIDINGAGCLHLRRDLFDVPSSGLIVRQMSILSSLSPQETTVFAAAVLQLAQEGRHAGSYRHEQAFSEAVSRFTTLIADDSLPVDSSAICASRRRLLLTEQVMLSSV